MGCSCSSFLKRQFAILKTLSLTTNCSCQANYLSSKAPCDDEDEDEDDDGDEDDNDDDNDNDDNDDDDNDDDDNDDDDKEEDTHSQVVLSGKVFLAQCS